LTLNAAEDKPVVAGDIIYIGPGCYREMLTVDVSGAGGNLITYVADVTGEHTDQVGGIVRITGSDNDQTTARAHCVTGSAKDYRVFRGFNMGHASAASLYGTNSDHWTVEDCAFTAGVRGVDCVGGGTDWTVRRCLAMFQSSYAIYFEHSPELDDSGHAVENCLLLASHSGMYVVRVGDITVKNCLIAGMHSYGIRVATSPNAGHPLVVNNTIFVACETAMRAAALGDLTEDFNTLFGNEADRTSVSVGGNSQTYPPLLLPPLLHAGVGQASGFQMPWWFGKLSEWSQVRAITGNNEPSVDLWGIGRPATASKNSWGPCQFRDMERETGTTRGASTASLCLHNAGRHQIWVPVANESTTISVYVYREANYAGNLPQMICKQPGQADDITTDVGAAGAWNLLTTTFTPAADPPYVVVELISRNTAAAGNFDCFWDDLVVN
jgi:hypothetical protein